MAALVSDHMAEMGIRIVLGDGIAGFNQNDEGFVENRHDGKWSYTPRGTGDSFHRRTTERRSREGRRARTRDDRGDQGRRAHARPATRTSGPPETRWRAYIRVTGKPAWIALAGPANKQGRAAGCNAV